MSEKNLIERIYAIAREIRDEGSPRYAPIAAAVFGAHAARARLSTLRAIEAEALNILAEVRNA